MRNLWKVGCLERQEVHEVGLRFTFGWGCWDHPMRPVWFRYVAFCVISVNCCLHFIRHMPSWCLYCLLSLTYRKLRIFLWFLTSATGVTARGSEVPNLQIPCTCGKPLWTKESSMEDFWSLPIGLGAPPCQPLHEFFLCLNDGTPKNPMWVFTEIVNSKGLSLVGASETPISNLDQKLRLLDKPEEGTKWQRKAS